VEGNSRWRRGERAAAGRSDDGARTVEAEGGASVRWRRFLQWRACGCGSGEGGLPLDGEKGRGRQIALIGIWSRFVWWGGDLDFEEKFVISSSSKIASLGCQQILPLHP